MTATGTLAFVYKDFQMTDGVNYHTPLSLSLVYRMLFRKATRPLISGRWMVIGKFIVGFKKDNYVYKCREEILNRRGV